MNMLSSSSRLSALAARALACLLSAASFHTAVSAQDATSAPEGLAAAADAPHTMLRLRSGGIAFGQILAHDPDGVRFRLLESGGEVPLPWSTLDPDEASEMRARFGYAETEAEELMVGADRIELATGQELVGRIVKRTETHLWVKRAEGTVPVPTTQVRGAITNVLAPALDLFTREELYQEKAFELQGRLAAGGRAGAQAHDELARYAERLLDYPHALEHFQRAAELDPSYDAARIAQAIARAETKAALQEQVDHLAAIDLQRARKGYARAIALVAEFRTLYPKSPLLADLNALTERVAKSQERDLRAEVVSRWHYWTVRLAREIARNTSLEQVQDYLDEKMAEDLAQKVRDDVQSIAPGIEAEEVRRLWGERKGGRYRTATYGFGSWLLGPSARAERDTEEKGVEPPKGSAAEARKKLEEKIKRYLENQRLTRQSSSAPDASEDPQAFWESWNWAGRSQWVLAWFAEKSGEFRDIQVRFENCRDCGGTGVRDVLFTGSAMTSKREDGSSASGASQNLVVCPTCHHLGVVRRIRYR